MLEAIALCEPIAGRELDWTLSRRAAHRRSPLVDLRPRRRSSATTRTGSSRYDVEAMLREIHDAQRRALGGRRGVKLSVVIPAHNEAGVDRRDASAAIAADARARRDRLRDPRRRRRAARDGTGERRRARSPSATRASAASARPTPPGFGFAVRAGLERFHGRRRGDRDGRRLRRSRRTSSLLPRCSSRATTARSARASCRGGQVDDYPRFKLVINRVVNARHPRALPPRLQRHDERVQGLPARGDRERPAAALQPLQPHGRAAAEGGRARPLATRSCRSPGPTARRGESKLALQEMGSRYLFIVLYVFLEHHLSRGDYRRTDIRNSRAGRAGGEHQLSRKP